MAHAGEKLPLLALLLCGAVAACGAEPDGDSEDGDGSGSTTVVSSGGLATPASDRLISIPVMFGTTSGSSTVFSLTDPIDDYEIEMTDCLSQHSAAVTKADASGLQAYRY